VIELVISRATARYKWSEVGVSAWTVLGADLYMRRSGKYAPINGWGQRGPDRRRDRDPGLFRFLLLRWCGPHNGLDSLG